MEISTTLLIFFIVVAYCGIAALSLAAVAAILKYKWRDDFVYKFYYEREVAIMGCCFWPFGIGVCLVVIILYTVGSCIGKISDWIIAKVTNGRWNDV